ncbi:MAG: hypothetical protein CME64_03615 [Halobacteriovoraceae bacterium]|nr:hypothetical protein [Halobacteriovoraceae bacterium]|tara:strand:+ start:3001 stop:4365 length:1365 start_codon:yes stop_codon:yes gene_type:complete
MKRNFGHIASLIPLLIFISCGKELTEVNSAPGTQDQAGIIAACATVEQAKEYSIKNGSRYRVINSKRNLIEFYDTDLETLKKAIPSVKTRSNKVYEYQLVQSNSAQAHSTRNQQFYGAHRPQYRQGDVSRYFPHLRQVKAHDLTAKGEGVSIAIVDTGVYYNHPHISPNIKVNVNDRHGDNGDGRDNDGNGFADDYAGWDFYNGDAFPIDDHGHGTHVAGLAAGTYGGIAPKAKVLPVKVLNSDGRGDLGTIAAGILYAVDMGVDIVNLSLGGPEAGQAYADIQALLGSVISARDNNILLVAAAGNGGADGLGDCNDATPVYPASFDEDNILSVASVDRYNSITSYSNFGTESVHVAAPGGDSFFGGLLSLGLPNCYGPCSDSEQSYTNMSGTSMAAPVVAGIAALIKSVNPSLSFQEIKKIIMEQGDFEESLRDKVKSSKVVNALMAVREAAN